MLALHHTPKFGAPGETRTHNPLLKRQVPYPIWPLTHGGAERTRTVIVLVDNQVPHLSATAPKKLPSDDCQLPIGAFLNC